MTEIKHEHLIFEIKNLKLADQLRLLEEEARCSPVFYQWHPLAGNSLHTDSVS